MPFKNWRCTKLVILFLCYLHTIDAITYTTSDTDSLLTQGVFTNTNEARDDFQMFLAGLGVTEDFSAFTNGQMPPFDTAVGEITGSIRTVILPNTLPMATSMPTALVKSNADTEVTIIDLPSPTTCIGFSAVDLEVPLIVTFRRDVGEAQTVTTTSGGRFFGSYHQFCIDQGEEPFNSVEITTQTPILYRLDDIVISDDSFVVPTPPPTTEAPTTVVPTSVCGNTGSCNCACRTTCESRFATGCFRISSRMTINYSGSCVIVGQNARMTGRIDGTSGTDCVLIEEGATVTNRIQMRNGDDCVFIQSGAHVSDNIVMGNGNDCIESDSASIHIVRMGNGDDYVSLYNTDSDADGNSRFGQIDGDAGDDCFSIDGNPKPGVTRNNPGVPEGHLGDILGGAGSDTITIKNVMAVEEIKGESGNDCISVMSSEFDLLQGGAGNDEISVSSWRSSEAIQGNAGDDFITATMYTRSPFTGDVSGGSGSDFCCVDNTAVTSGCETDCT